MPGTRRPRRRGSRSGHRTTLGAIPRTAQGGSGRRPLIRPRTRRRIMRWGILLAAGIVAILVIGSFGLTSIPNLSPRGTGATSFKDGVGEPQDIFPTASHRDVAVDYQPDRRITSLESEAEAGATMIAVVSSSGFATGDTVELEDPDIHRLVAVEGNELTLGSSLSRSYSSGEIVVRKSIFELPPTSGDHAFSPTGCGFNERGIFLPDETIVHNMEHGNVIMSYNLTDPLEIDQIRDVHNSLAANREWLVTRFYDQIPEGDIAMTAWGILDQFTGIDEDRIREFFNAYRGNRFSNETDRLGRGIPCGSGG